MQVRLRHGACRADAEIAALRARVEALEAGLDDAADCIEAWGAYADSYFRDKHDLAGDIARARALLEQKP